jgi:uncharacterized SAM-binding protein YcdF (DUF218 family)
MIRRILSLAVLAWLLGFIVFAIALPRPHEGSKSDAVVVLTGGGGRIGRGLETLQRGWARRMLVSGVDRQVSTRAFQAEYKVPPALMACCVTLDYHSVDTRSNARETARWIADNKFRSVRLVTTDWHMRRAAMELAGVVPTDVTLIRDAVPSRPTFRILFVEYNKLLARWALRLAGQ